MIIPLYDHAGLSSGLSAGDCRDSDPGLLVGCRLFRSFPKGAEDNRFPQTKNPKELHPTHALQKKKKKERTNKTHPRYCD